MLKLKNSKPYLSGPIKHCNLRLAQMFNYYNRFPSCVWIFITYILRGINGQLITQCLRHLNLWVKQAVSFSDFL